MVLVTGGTGLLGSHLLYELASSGEEIRAIKRASSNIEHIRDIFSYYTSSPENLVTRIKWIEGDVLDITSLLEAMKGVEHVYHCAAVVSFHPNECRKMIKVNVEGTANVVNAALLSNIRKLGYVSSIASLGRAENEGIIDENTFWKSSKKNSNYAVSKYFGENEVWRGINEGLNAVIINPAIIFGPGFWHKGSNKLIKTIYKGIGFYTEGVNGFVDARDVSRALVMLMRSNINGERYIISSENISYKELIHLCSEALGIKKPAIKTNKPLAEIYWRLEKIKSILTGSKPLITKETARTAFEKFYYSNNKIKEAVNLEFIPIENTMKFLAGLFLEHIKNDGDK